MKNAWDTKYIPEEFAQEAMTSPGNEHLLTDHLDPIDEEGKLPYFEQFSYHGSAQSYDAEGYLSASAQSSGELF